MEIGPGLPPLQEPPEPQKNLLKELLDKVSHLEANVKGGVIAAYLGFTSPSMVITPPTKEGGPLQILEQRSGDFCDVHLSLKTFLEIVKCFRVWNQSKAGNQTVLRRRGVL